MDDPHPPAKQNKKSMNASPLISCAKQQQETVKHLELSMVSEKHEERLLLCCTRGRYCRSVFFSNHEKKSPFADTLPANAGPCLTPLLQFNNMGVLPCSKCAGGVGGGIRPSTRRGEFSFATVKRKRPSCTSSGNSITSYNRKWGTKKRCGCDDTLLMTKRSHDQGAVDPEHTQDQDKINKSPAKGRYVGDAREVTAYRVLLPR